VSTAQYRAVGTLGNSTPLRSIRTSGGRAGGDGVQRGIADVDIGTTGPPCPGLVLVAGVPLTMIASVVARWPGGRTPCPHRTSATTSRIPTLPGSDVVLTNESVPIRESRTQILAWDG